MNKFEGITVIHLESSDYDGEALNPAVEREIDTSDIVNDGNKVVKNRVSKMGCPQVSGALKLFKGLSLEPVDVLKNISTIIESGSLLTATSDKKYQEIVDMIIGFARDYAAAAHAYALEEKK